MYMKFWLLWNQTSDFSKIRPFYSVLADIQTGEILHVSMPSSSSSVAAGRSQDLSMAALKLSLQPRPLMIRGRGRWKGRSPLRVTSATAVWRLSRELDFFKPSDGPTSFVEEPDGRIQTYSSCCGNIKILPLPSLPQQAPQPQLTSKQGQLKRETNLSQYIVK